MAHVKPHQPPAAPAPASAGATPARVPAAADIPAEIVAAWWARRGLLLVVAVLSVAVFAAAVKSLPKRYRTSAVIAIQPPRFLPETRAEPLSVPSAKTLLGADELTAEVIGRIRLAKPLVEKAVAVWNSDDPERFAKMAALEPARLAGYVGDEARRAAGGDDTATSALLAYVADLTLDEVHAVVDFPADKLDELTPQDLGPALGVEDVIERKTAVEVKLSPLLNLTAQADDPRRAALFANTWARLFERKYGMLTTEKTRTLFESIQRQQLLSQDEMERGKTGIVAFKARHNLELLQRQIDDASEAYRDFNRQLTQKAGALSVETARLTELRALGAAMERDGRWLGHDDAGDTATTTATSPAAGQVSTADAAGAAGAIQTRIARSREQRRAAVAELRRARLADPTDMLARDRDRFQLDLLDLETRVRSGESTVTVAAGELAALDARVGGATGATSMTASSEFTSARAAAADRLRAARGETEPLKALIPAKRAELAALQGRLDRATLAEGLLKENADRQARAAQDLFDLYAETNNGIASSARQLGLLRAEVTAVDESASAALTAATALQKQFDRAANELSLLEQHQRAVQKQADLYTAKLQDARAALTAESSDVTVAALAVAPAYHVFPKTLPVVGGSTLVVMAAVMAALARARFMALKAEGRA